jgi:hypothetical protein
MTNVKISLLLLIVSCCPAVADGKLINLLCESETSDAEAFLAINLSMKTIGEQSTLVKGRIAPEIRSYRDGNRVTTYFGAGTQFVNFDEEFINYGTRYDANPNGYPGATNTLDRRTGNLRWGSMGDLQCEIAKPPVTRDQIPKKF